MSGSTGIRWKRIVVFGLLAEVTVILLAAAANALQDDFAALRDSVIPLSFLATFLFGWLAARKTKSRPALYGFLVGVMAVLFYFGTEVIAGIVARLANATVPHSELSPPYVYQTALVMKLLGGAAGGLAAFRRLERADPALALLNRRVRS